MAELEGQLASIQVRLADSAIYEGDQRDELAQTLREEGELKNQASELEELWFEQQHSLEELNT